ncbi:imidazole glycerol phosphate synthase subunit HisF [Buchnera aphidicola]|uniref:imidazole glycerol-phosphate synthase n=1 Tax=Buchnera aphidicola subsp. Tuberolachnus salignus TaxID=98804 RepID=A0A160SYQ0_BUCTT|nr:imidazole glycerol phosphate synthase subunit HisF [Buchnera aphidicola]CUR53056.1 Imidazole glycerol phosphate synthase subunit HisF [Buchnera aphidicola (Tuberolachnus salignus)]
MLAKRIIPCLDVKNEKVVKGKKFEGHIVMGDIMSLAKFYSDEGADEIIFYDIIASTEKKLVDTEWISQISEIINIPFCVAGGIQSVHDAKKVLSFGADKISINTPALNDPYLISRLADCFGTQCVVVGIDSWYNKDLNEYEVFQNTGDIKKKKKTVWKTLDWIQYVQTLGAGEIVLNTMNHDGLENGFDLIQLKNIRSICKVPLIASGGAGTLQDFLDVFVQSQVDGALAASVFHKKKFSIYDVKKFLNNNGVQIRL